MNIGWPRVSRPRAERMRRRGTRRGSNPRTHAPLSGARDLAPGVNERGRDLAFVGELRVASALAGDLQDPEGIPPASIASPSTIRRRQSKQRRATQNVGDSSSSASDTPNSISPSMRRSAGQLGTGRHESSRQKKVVEGKDLIALSVRSGKCLSSLRVPVYGELTGSISRSDVPTMVILRQPNAVNKTKESHCEGGSNSPKRHVQYLSSRFDKEISLIVGVSNQQQASYR
ncbi:hypothetical protein VTI74DRAFT_6092 [Chaetomium olivicolor]